MLDTAGIDGTYIPCVPSPLLGRGSWLIGGGWRHRGHSFLALSTRGNGSCYLARDISSQMAVSWLIFCPSIVAVEAFIVISSYTCDHAMPSR